MSCRDGTKFGELGLQRSVGFFVAGGRSGGGRGTSSVGSMIEVGGDIVSVLYAVMRPCLLVIG